MIKSIKEYAVKRSDLGVEQFKPPTDYMINLSEAGVHVVRYHSSCRKKLSINFSLKGQKNDLLLMTYQLHVRLDHHHCRKIKIESKDTV